MANVCILYFAPDFKKGNGVAVFDEWEASKLDTNKYLFVKYLVNWVAGTKLIFIVLLLVILLFGSSEIKEYAALVMIASIATYFWRLHPIMKELDKQGKLSPKGYSTTLARMIMGFILLFGIAYGYELVFS